MISSSSFSSEELSEIIELVKQKIFVANAMGDLDSLFAQTRIRQLDEDMDKLIGVRTRQIQKALKNVQELDVPSSEVLEIESDIE